MAETSKNKIYYNDNENSVANVLADMKKMAESTDKAIENSKYNDATIKKNISDIEEKQSIKDSEQDSKIAELQTEKAKLETELKEMQEDFYQNSIRGQASGEYIHVEDSSNCRAKIGIGGNHEQETTKGYNLLNFLDNNMTSNGVESLVNKNIFNISGTITNASWANITQTSKTSAVNCKSGNTYTIVINQALVYSFVAKYNKNKDIPIPVGKTYITFSASEDCTSLYFFINASVGTTVNIKDLQIMIYEGEYDSSKTFEDYTGGQPSPNPEYLQEINTVGSNVNLLENTLKSQTINGIDVEVKDNGEITLNGISTDSFALVIGKINKIKNMTFSGMCDGYGYNKMIAQVQGLNYNVNVVNSNQITLSDLDTEATVRLYIYKETSITNAIIKPKIVEGTEIGEYSKHGQGCVKVTKCNKNLAIKNIKGYFSISDFKIKIDNNSESFLFYAEKGKEYTRSCKVNLDRNRIGKIDTLDVTQGMTVLNGQEINSKKFICDDSGIYIWFVNSTLNDSIKESFQIEEGSTESPFEQHEEQSYIMPVQAEMLENDYFDYDNEEEVHVWGKLILTGNEVFTKGYDKERVSGFYTSIDELKNIDKKQNYTLSGFLCNCLIEKKFYTNNISDEVWGNVNTFAFSTANQHRLALNIENITTVDELKAYLKAQYDAGTPVMIYYKLQTPTRLAFTDEQKEVAKELSNARTYKNVTNITTDSKAILDLDYAKDLETLLNNTQALAVSNASEGV